MFLTSIAREDQVSQSQAQNKILQTIWLNEVAWSFSAFGWFPPHEVQLLWCPIFQIFLYATSRNACLSLSLSLLFRRSSSQLGL